MDHATKAVELFMQGYNCAQSVFCAFCDLTKLDFETSLKLSSSMGGGVGRLREICGALSGMLLVAGCLYGYTDVSTNDAKSEHYALVQQLAKSFEEKTGAITCRDILGIKGSSEPCSPPRDASFYATRPCAKMVQISAQILDEYVSKHPYE